MRELVKIHTRNVVLRDPPPRCHEEPQLISFQRPTEPRPHVIQPFLLVVSVEAPRAQRVVEITGVPAMPGVISDRRPPEAIATRLRNDVNIDAAGPRLRRPIAGLN